MSRPPPKDLLKAVAEARAELALRVTERKAAWDPPPAQRLPCFEWECDWAPKNFHTAFQRWQQARDELARLERQLAAHQAHRAEELAHE